jgi:agmatine deiminase
MKIYLHRPLLFLLFSCSVSFAQSPAGNIPFEHRMTDSEKENLPEYRNIISQNSSAWFTAPPTVPVRAAAEWEEIDYLMVAWTSYTAIIREIVRYASAETQVIIICGNNVLCSGSTDSTTIKNTLTSNGISLTNIHFLYAPCNSIWSRDYGQWNIYVNSDVDSLALIDWIYNRNRPKDDTVPSAIAGFTGLPMYQTTVAPNNLVHTGGNFMTDGFGTGFSSNLILTDNLPTAGFGANHTSAEIDTIMKNFMGINRYVKMTTLPYDVIHHIDMHLKLLDEETLLVGEYPAGVADGPQIEANLQYILSNYNSVFGTPYKVVRIPMPPDANGDYPNISTADYRTYTNAVFVNKTIILPTYSPQYDTTAIRIWQEALPGYAIKTINCNSIIGQLGAIHCITKEVASSNPLLISHQPLHDTYNTAIPYEVDALIEHRSSIANASVYYRTDTLLPYQSATMSTVDGTHWTGYIPAQSDGTTIYYYIEATSVSGKTQVRPMPAPAGYWKFKILTTAGINETASRNNLELRLAFPNPSKGITCIPVSNSVSQNVNILLKDVLGRTVQSIYNGEIPKGEKKYFINTESFASGVYFIELKSTDQTLIQKLIVR